MEWSGYSPLWRRHLCMLWCWKEWWLTWVSVGTLCGVTVHLQLITALLQVSPLLMWEMKEGTFSKASTIFQKISFHVGSIICACWCHDDVCLEVCIVDVLSYASSFKLICDAQEDKGQSLHLLPLLSLCSLTAVWAPGGSGCCLTCSLLALQTLAGCSACRACSVKHWTDWGSSRFWFWSSVPARTADPKQRAQPFMGELSAPVWIFTPLADCAKSLSHVQLFVTPWTVASQAPLSMGFSRQECWSGLPCPPPGDLPDPGIEPSSFMSPALAGWFFTTSATSEGQTRRLIPVSFFPARDNRCLL